MIDDAELLRRYAENRDQAAFAALVRAHVDLVHSAALRQVNGDAHLAADVTQLVFCDLARKAGAVARHRALAGWLFTSTRFAAAKIVRGEQRRRRREQEAQLMQENDDQANTSLDWDRVRPVLDEAIAGLGETDRTAILLRFFEGRDFAGVGTSLHLTANTARMRVERALEKLQAALARRGVTSTAAALATAMAAQAVAGAPAGLAASVTGTALAGGGAATIGAGLLSFMATAKLPLGIAAAVAVAGTTGIVVQAESNAALRAEAASLRAQSQGIVALQAENSRLTRSAVEVADLQRDDAEFARLQEQAATLKAEWAARTAAASEAAARRVVATQTSAAIAETSIVPTDRGPIVRVQKRPVFPFEMRRAGISGEVIVDVVVDTDGKVRNAYALRSSHREFEAAAVEAVNAWQFDPAVKGARSVNTHMQIPIVFSLSERDAPDTAAGTPAPVSDNRQSVGSPLRSWF